MNYIPGAIFIMGYTDMNDRKRTILVSFWAKRVARIVLKKSFAGQWHCNWFPVADFMSPLRLGPGYAAIAVCPENKQVAFIKL